ncbi:MAG: hypothetical protein JNJ43_12835 [Anaerolineales bacterium]|nr:hypothetical protein [Anaerolineales bacterium]
MDNIEKYLEDLKSTSANRRFEACKSLRRIKEIPESAVNALLETTNDTDFLVAWEAKKALKSHNVPIETHSNEFDASQSKKASIFPLLAVLCFMLSCLVFGIPSSKPLPSSVQGLAFLNNLLPAALLFVLGLIFLLPLLDKKSQTDNPQDSNVKTRVDSDKNGEKTDVSHQ